MSVRISNGPGELSDLVPMTDTASETIHACDHRWQCSWNAVVPAPETNPIFIRTQFKDTMLKNDFMLRKFSTKQYEIVMNWNPFVTWLTEAKPSTWGTGGTTCQHMTYVWWVGDKPLKIFFELLKGTYPCHSNRNSSPSLSPKMRTKTRVGAGILLISNVNTALLGLPQILTATHKSIHLFPMTQSHRESHLAGHNLVHSLQRNQFPEMNVLSRVHSPKCKDGNKTKVLFKTNEGD